MDRERWVVNYIDGDGHDDWQLMRNSSREFFPDKESAIKFAEKHEFKKKPFYWQPTVHKEVERIFSYPRWIREE
jgi:hypothetical protein